MGVFEKMLAQSSRKPSGLHGVLERRAKKRDPMLRTSTTGLTSHLWELELVPAFGLIRLCDDIDQLAERTLDRNIFFESPVLRAAWPRLTSLMAPRGAWMLCLWESTGKGRSLRLFMPVRLHKIGFPGQMVLQTLANHYMPVGTPMIDSDCAEEAAEILLRLLADPVLKLPQVVDFTWQRDGGASYRVLQQAAGNLGLASIRNQAHERAALFPDPADGDKPKPPLSKKRMRELARQLRKLDESGATEFKCAQTTESVMDAIEGFMTLELKGWKGRKGTALYNQKKIAAFSRQIVAELASKNHCEIFALYQNDKPIASLIMLGREGYLVPWKMAFDERLSAHSPGMQVMVNTTMLLQQRPGFIEADSLAIADHVMMNRVWSDRIGIADLTVSVSPKGTSRLQKVVKSKQHTAKLRRTAKAVLAKLPSR